VPWTWSALENPAPLCVLEAWRVVELMLGTHVVIEVGDGSLQMITEKNPPNLRAHRLVVGEAEERWKRGKKRALPRRQVFLLIGDLVIVSLCVWKICPCSSTPSKVFNQCFNWSRIGKNQLTSTCRFLAAHPSVALLFLDVWKKKNSPG